ncbi:TIGR01777 family oxidoreductase [Desertivirga arenae]|uniref:TIGR01777 family oxidoreductase n=1 Tax=Desertivirga arenae TaxID=2810309 RepID=UPI001A9707DD|nr:TIGR01777 family oxidoreductase [Pedobacter sp. SYSU D00823]
MRYNKIVLAGGNGYLGGVLAHYFKSLAEEVIILSRRPKPAVENIRTIVWDAKTEGEWIENLKGAELLVNLCGKNVNCRYTSENRSAIYSSRLGPTGLLRKVVSELSDPPKLWVNVTSATIYRHAEDAPQTERAGELGYGFSVDVCQKWEEVFFGTNTPETRKVALRMGIVLGQKDGVFPRLLNLVKFGLGGKQGSGSQYVSWIHEQDVARCTEWLLEHEGLNGVVNCTAPQPLTNADLMKVIRQAYGVPFGLPSPAWLLGLGARVIGTEPELILKSRWVLPERLTDSGFTFQFPDAGSAVRDIISIRV